MKKLIEVHVLQNFAPSNLNRDDTGAPKDALFGGTRRARISSQCQKRAMRCMFDCGALIDRDNLGVYTKRLADEIKKILVEMGRPEDDVLGKIYSALASTGISVTDDGKTQYLIFFGRQEIRALADIIDANWNDLATARAVPEADKEEESRKAKKEKEKQANPKIAKAIGKILNGGKAADVALFGRMLTDMPEKNQDAACQVAHAISTHVVEREFDFYTAIDDLRPAEVSGADMMGSVDFNSACFYRYVCLNVDLLEGNLQGDHELARKAIRASLDAFVRSEPTGKQNTFAAHNPPEFILIRIAKDAAPLSLANAFESPVRAGRNKSLTCLSAEKLVEKAIRLREQYGLSGDSFILNVCDAEVPDNLGETIPSWPALLDKVTTIVEEW